MYVRSVSCVFERTGQEHRRAGSLIRQIVAYDLLVQSWLFFYAVTALRIV